MADDFCKFFDTMMAKYTLPSTTKRKYHRDSTMSKTEIMLILILFHDSGYCCLKHFYQEKVCKYMRHFFPKVVSYNRFVELENAKNLNLNGQKQARKVLKLVKKNIPLFLKKRHEEFLKTSNVFSKTSNVFFKTTVCFKEPSLAKYKSLIMKQIQVCPCE